MIFDDAVNHAGKLVEFSDALFGEGNQNVRAHIAVYLMADSDSKASMIKGGILLAAESAKWFDVMKGLAALHIRKGQELPEALGLWAADTLDGHHLRPKADPRTTEARNVNLAGMVKEIKEIFSLKPTRNGGSPEHSACDAVAKAAGYGYETVEAAWLKYNGLQVS